MLPQLVKRFRDLVQLRQLQTDLPVAGASIRITGLPGSSSAVLLAALSEELRQRVLLLVAATPTDAERWYTDLNMLLADVVRHYPQREIVSEEESHVEIAGERAETIEAVLSGRVRVLVTTLHATLELSRMPSLIAGRRLTIDRVRSIPLGEVVTRLTEMGYERCPAVRDVAQFAVRGGIVDVYGFGMAAPARLEWWDDAVTSIRSFNLDSQLSEVETETVTLLPVAAPSADAVIKGMVRQSLLDLLPPDTLLIVTPETDVSAIGRFWEEDGHHIRVAHRRGEDVPNRDEIYREPGDWLTRWNSFARIELDPSEGKCDFGLSTPVEIGRDIKKLRKLARSSPTLILCDNEGQLERLEELLSEGDIPGEKLPSWVTLALGSLHGGFVLPDLIVLTDHEIFRRTRRIRRSRRYRQAVGTAATESISPGAYVVHLEHGIGIYRGMETIEVGSGSTIDVAVIEYEGGDRLNVPVYRLDQLEPFRLASDETRPPPKIDKLGGTRWRKQRAKTQAAVRQLAAELLELYAQRSIAPGFAFPPDTQWQRELESSFLYEDTPDQRRATEETKRDMERPQPADRLVVGDVGYGKTEVAVRAVFKAVQAGKQAAILVPTTILAEQHGRTIGERLAEYPVTIEVLSRFRTAAEQKKMIEGVRNGTVDIVIGTHRLLSKDVEFHDLGLLIVDEEHRFGVQHKERLKALRLAVDVITLTATPIPRTLHLALSGLRDMTLMETAPRDRSPVLTFIELWDDELLEEVLARELDRGGQVYFVHNRIETIETIAERVKRLVARRDSVVETAHGRMRERDLDRVMRSFVAGEIDVLVSTMIVESGLDVPNANTMIVHDAHKFGLAQLYQLRGRVGRGHRRAYCYLLTPDTVAADAEQRLKVLEHHTELGAGYQIALRDLELRGAGNLLGAEQSGHTHAVGFDMFMRWLNETVQALKGDIGAEQLPPPEVVLDRAAYLPDAYLPDDDAKLDFYRRLARAGELSEIVDLRAELRDRFGPLPDEADRLLIVSELQALGAKLGLATVIVRGDEARLKFRAGTAPRLVRLSAALDDVQFSAEVRRTMPLSLRLTRLGGVDIGSGLVRALTAAVADDDAAAHALALGVSQE